MSDSHPGPIGHLMILASAGTGKTHRLSSRYLQLLARGESPESLVALTFTRKAAGEFLERILGRLSEAAILPEKRAALAGDIGFDTISDAELQAWLRLVIDGMPRLTLGTLDSFFVRVLQTYGHEFGLSSGFEILGDHALALEKQSTIDAVLRSERNGAFIAAFRAATFGSEEKSLAHKLGQFIGDFHALYLNGPEENLWGGTEAIWPDGCEWFAEPVGDISQTVAEFRERIAQDELTDNQLEVWEQFLGPVSTLKPVHRLELNTPVKNVFSALESIRAGAGVVTIARRKHELTEDESRLLWEMIRHIMRCEITAAQERTRGIWCVLDRYECAYNERVRRHGLLSFADLPLILTGEHLRAANESAPLLGHDDARDAVLDVGFRLDARFRHWMLDEFQDTSFGQWKVIRNLIDEAVQDLEGERSFFYVGDVKQAIYGWRGGDSRLFHEIRDHYNRNAPPELIAQEELHVSRRSGRDVIDSVNAVFGNESTLTGMFGTEASREWRRNWSRHEAHEPDKPGCFLLVNTIKPKGGGRISKEVHQKQRFRIALQLLEELGVRRNQLTCAVLVRTNKVGEAFTDFVRAENSAIPIEMDIDVKVADDNPLATAVLSLLKFAAHPGDTFAWRHLEMTPLAEVIISRNLDQATLPVALLAQVQASGFQATLADWIGALDSAGVVLDPFSRTRADQLLQAAGEFDRRGSRSVDAFLNYADSYSLRESSLPGTVQVMTIHKAKGLGFDAVLLIDLESGDLCNFGQLKLAAYGNEEREVLVTETGTNREILWALDMPRKTFAEADPVLHDFIERRQAKECFENLCDLYVAMTRAKHATYVVTDPPSASSQTYGRLLHDTLDDGSATEASFGEEMATVVRETGDRQWFGRRSPSGDEPDEDAQLPPPITAPLGMRSCPALTTLRPSVAGHGIILTGHQIFGFVSSSTTLSSAVYGSLVHALFERIEWLDDLGDDYADKLRSSWEADKVRILDQANLPDAGSAWNRAVVEVLGCLEEQPVRQALSHPPGVPPERCELWRERRFELLIDGQRHSGTFDRVTLVRDADGKFESGTILDFKTDQATTEEAIRDVTEKYHSQLELYGQALAKLTGLARKVIRSELLFTKERRLGAPVQKSSVLSLT